MTNFTKKIITKRNKIKEDKRKEEEWYQGRMFGSKSSISKYMIMEALQIRSLKKI